MVLVFEKLFSDSLLGVSCTKNIDKKESKMKAFGISALIIAIISIFVPVMGYLTAGLSGFLAIFSAGKGTPWGLSAVIINIANILLLSPILVSRVSDKYAISAEHQAQSKTILGVLLLIQFVAICAFILKKLLGRKREANKSA
jgi:hypothetical protein